MNQFDVIIVGGGQSGLAVAYYLRRTGLSFIILDNQTQPGGAWLHTWKSLRLFSPAQWSSLPGMPMPGGSNYYPTRDETIEYLGNYEVKYNLPIKRPVEVMSISSQNDQFKVDTSDGFYFAKVVVCATGSAANPYIPKLTGMDIFMGEILHSNQYTTPENFVHKRVAIVGEGNSGAQILAEVSKVTDTWWITQKDPRFLPDHIDGRYLFDAATQMYEAQKSGKAYKTPSLGDIVMVPPVKEARARNVLRSVPPFDHFTEDALVWRDGTEEKIDVVIFCTGFKPSLHYLEPLQVLTDDGKVNTVGTKAIHINGLWLVGYGNWTGFASATLIGVGRSAKETVDQIVHYVTSSQF